MSCHFLELATTAAAKAAEAFPACPFRLHQIEKYHTPEVCQAKPSRPTEGHLNRGSIYEKLIAGGLGASMVPNQQTVTCPLGEVASLEQTVAPGGGAAAGQHAPLSKGFDTTWIVENTSSKPVVLAWVVGGVEYSPFKPDVSPMDDPRAWLQPGEWTSVPTFESYVYHVHAIDENGGLGDVVLQHRAGMIPLGRSQKAATIPQGGTNDSSLPDGLAGLNLAGKKGTKLIDAEPVDRELLEQPKPKQRQQEVGREDAKKRNCNTVDVGFRNEAGFPLSVYWASNLEEIPVHGFSCAESYKFHMGVKAATQDFMFDWNSNTKYEGSLIGHTFVARKADDPSVVVDKYTLEPTRIIDCPRNKKEQVVQVPATTCIDNGIGGSCPNQDGEDRDDRDEDNNNDNVNDLRDLILALRSMSNPPRSVGGAFAHAS